MANKDDNAVLLAELGSPKRRKILQEIRRHPGGLSPSEVAETMGESLGTIGYHCRVLRDCGAIELVKQEPVRGALKNYYRFSVTDQEAIEVLEQDDDDGREAAADS